MFGSHTPFLFTLMLLTVCYVAGAIAAGKIGMLTPVQMRDWVADRGISYFSHFGMLNDPHTVHPLIALNVELFWPVWKDGPLRDLMLIAIPVALIAAYLLNQSWAKATKQSRRKEAHAMHGKLTIVGWIHVPHTAIILWAIIMMIATLGLGYMHPTLAIANISLLVAHALLGTHWPLKVFDPWWNPLGEAEDTDKRIGLACTVLQCVGISSLCYWAIP